MNNNDNNVIIIILMLDLLNVARFSCLIKCGYISDRTFLLTCRATIVARPFKFDTSDRFA